MQTWKLLLVGLVIHTVFFYSIFDIYFTSPIVHGMTPHTSPVPAPAKRLVLFSADGLRADKMFELDDKSRTWSPHLRSILEHEGAWGVSHTRVPTESRPGHVALIAGFYEDVSAVAKGWKENPVEFDSVFNESRYTWSWGSPDILPMFAKGATGDHVFTECYPAHFEDFSASDSAKLDTWVFDKVKAFFADSKSNENLSRKLHEEKIIFFLHLLGIDTNGHSKKPYSNEYMENIRLVDEGIKEMVELIEAYYNHDGKTAYVMSSDHGMTDWGSHGAGHPSETLTPLVAWGAGVRGPIQQRNTSSQEHDQFSQAWKLNHIKRTDVEQADVAPLMAALVGVNFPLNSVGILPHDYLAANDYEKAELLYANSQQILEQYQVKMDQKKSTTLSVMFRPFSELTPGKLAERHRHIHTLIQDGQYLSAIEASRDLMDVALRGLNYYQTYDRLFLGASIFFGFTGWMAYVFTVLFEEHSGIVKSKVKLDHLSQPFWRTDGGIVTIYAVIGAVVTILLFVQSLPWTNYLYCLIPVALWMVVSLRFDILRQVYTFTCSMKNRNSFLTAVSVCCIGLEILVIGFFYREMLSVGLALMGLVPWISAQRSIPKTSMLGWTLACSLLSVFPLLPVVTGKRHTTYVIVGGVLIVLGSVWSWYRFSAEVLNNIRKGFEGKCWLNHHHKFSKRTRFLFTAQVILVTIATYFSGYVVESGMSSWQHALSWTILGLSLVEALLGPTIVTCRLLLISLAFVAPFILLSVSYEVLFIISLWVLLDQWLHMEGHILHGDSYKGMIERSGLEALHFTSTRYTAAERPFLVVGDIQRAFYFVFLILTAFFGTGNIASINSFDPSAVLCFVSVFSPFVMGALLLFKILVPFILVACTLQAIHTVTQVPIQGLFLLILLMSDCMALHFFFLVRDYGSWLDIGTSISHYVIVMCMIIFIMMLFGLSHVLTHWKVRGAQPHRHQHHSLDQQGTSHRD